MKTTIIQLEKHDDIVSARDKMGWAKGGRILLVWPERSATLNRRLDLVLLQRHSAALGAPLAIVSQDSEVRYYALRLGVPVFKSLKKAQKAHWRAPHRFRKSAPPARQPALLSIKAPPPEASIQRRLPQRPDIKEPALSPAARLVYFGLGVLALLAIAAVLVPKATLRLTPQTRTQDEELEMWSAPNLQTSDLTGAVPSHWVTVSVEGRDSLPASSSIPIAEQTAGGEVVFTNLVDEPVEVPDGTIVQTRGGNPVSFSVRSAGEIPTGPGTQLTLPVQALDPGERGNQPAGSLVAIEGLLGTQVGVSNPQPTSGGASRLVPAPSDEDRRQLRDRLFASLQSSALGEVQRQLEPGDLVIPSSLQLLETIQADYQPEVGLPADRLVLSLRVQYQALVVSANDLEAIARAVLDANLPDSFTTVDGSLRVATVIQPAPSEVAETSGPVYRWKVHAYRTMIAQVPAPQAVRLVLGRTRENAILRLQDVLALDGPAQITMQPEWWPRLPVLPFRVNVVTAPKQ